MALESLLCGMGTKWFEIFLGSCLCRWIMLQNKIYVDFDNKHLMDPISFMVLENCCDYFGEVTFRETVLKWFPFSHLGFLGIVL